MKPRPGLLRAPRERTLSWIVVAVLASFVVANGIAQHASSEIDSLSDGIANNSSPSIAALAAVRSNVMATELAVGHLVRDERDGSEVEAKVRRLQAELEAHVRTYMELPQFPGELTHWRAVQAAAVRFDEAVTRTLEVARGDRAAGASLYLKLVQPVGERVLDVAMDAIEFNAERGRELASRIKGVRWRAIWVGDLLMALCVAVAIAGGVLIRRQTRSRRALLETRVTELGEFAGRVAHDIRSPLAGARMTAELLARKTGDAATADKAGRILRSLARADMLIQGLLEFARAGGRPEPGARTDIRAVFADLGPSLAADAERAHVELVTEAIPPVMVACSGGVYLSLIGNLARNAMKYMGDAQQRRVTLRVTDERTHVRTEVIDTGPGVAAEALPRLFELWFRGNPAGGPGGFGLGLATVKRLAEGHGGSVGVRSTSGSGSCFWFLLPRAGVLSADDESSELPTPGATPTDGAARDSSGR